MNETLIARIRARNKVNAEANRLLPLYIAAFTPFLNKKIIVGGNSLSAKAAETFKSIKYNVHNVYRQPSNYSLYVTVKVCENLTGGHTCVYEEQTISVGELKDNVLVKLNNTPQSWKTDYTAEEIIAARKLCEQKRQELRDAENLLHGFGEYDR